VSGSGHAGDRQTWTPLALLQWCEGFFREKGIDTPKLDAERLLAHTLGCRRIDLYLAFDRPLAPAELDTFRDLVRRRAGREPVAYLTGEAGFWTLELAVGPGCLVPRPDTETLVEGALAAVDILREDAPTRPLRLMELGTGSGAIPLALCAERTGLDIVATDASPHALGYARANRERHATLLAPRQNRLTLVCCRDFAALAPALRADLIVSNPPYIPTADIAGLAPEVSRAEPRAALDGGPDGLAVYRRLLALAPRRLVAGGHMLLETGAEQAPALLVLLGEIPDLTLVDYRRDLAGRPRVLHVRRDPSETETT